jgi:hypothetical protein
MKKLTQSEYDEKVRAKWAKNLEVLTPYVNSRTLMRVRCLHCNDKNPWVVEAGELIKPKRVCPHKSYKNKPMDGEGYALKVSAIHGKSVEIVTSYVNARTKIGHRCNSCVCGKGSPTWFALPQVLLSGHTCPNRIYAEKRQQLMTQYDDTAISFGFIRRSTFTGIHNPTLYECMDCGHTENRTPRSFLNRTGKPRYCSVCLNIAQPRKFSKMAIRWLDGIARSSGVFIQHAENRGEYIIPGTRFSADGFCLSNNTIYELYGDCFHGNPKRFPSDEKCNPYSSLTAKELYAKTKARERIIRSKGYKLVTIWESDFKGK